MGLLDDAIREHLELMRRHGAPDDQVKRLEQEALGPVRRRGQPLLPPDDEELLDDEEAALADRAYDEGELADEAVAEIGVDLDQPVMPEPAGHEPAYEQYPEDELPGALPATEIHAADVPVREPQPGPEPVAETSDFVDDEEWLEDEEGEAPPDDLLEPPGQQTAAFSAADVAEAAGDAPPTAEEDVLEETPEFLQETPEHDRLWFEQRPPRRFDFDE